MLLLDRLNIGGDSRVHEGRTIGTDRPFPPDIGFGSKALILQAF
jgi:hypothetical protein